MTRGLAVLGSVRRATLERASTLQRWMRAQLERRRGAPPPCALVWLSPASKALLRRILAQPETTLRTASLPPGAIGLELADVIAIHREADGRFALAVGGWAAEQLRRHPGLLEG